MIFKGHVDRRGSVPSHSLLLPVIAVLFCLATPLMSKSEGNYTFTTATTGGTYYPVGVAVATLTKIKLEPKDKISLSAISSAGSGENIRLLGNNEAQFAILQGLYGAWAWNGKGAFTDTGPKKFLRSVTMLWRNVEHFTIQSDLVRSGNLSDMELLIGRRFSIGEENSGTEGSGRHILKRLGFTPERDFQLVHLGYGESAEALMNGSVAGINIPAGPPASAVARAFTALGKDITVLECTLEQLERINQGYGLWSEYDIPAGTYPLQDQTIRTIAQPNFMAVRYDVDDEAVYKIVKTIYNNLDFLNNIHQATRAMTLQNAISGLPIPLHPGAARFFREQGIDIPDQLIIE
ncbi:MAG: TAXI family TRAP transporter solute-binding subunit [Desulfocapsaceae bacterium]|nr:TAXI family TRAP transporter solute-binding subunit [Desulfocapsaceae bacterium]